MHSFGCVPKLHQKQTFTNLTAECFCTKYVIWSINLIFFKHHGRDVISVKILLIFRINSKIKPQKSARSIQFRSCTCRSRVLAGEPTIHMGNGCVGPYTVALDLCVLCVFLAPRTKASWSFLAPHWIETFQRFQGRQRFQGCQTGLTEKDGSI